MVAVLQPRSAMALKDAGERSLPLGSTASLTPGHSLCVEEMSQMYTNACTVASGLAGQQGLVQDCARTYRSGHRLYFCVTF